MKKSNHPPGKKCPCALKEHHVVKWVVRPIVKRMTKQTRAQFEQGKGILKRLGEVDKQTRNQLNQGKAVLEKLQEIDGLIEVIACEMAREKQKQSRGQQDGSSGSTEAGLGSGRNESFGSETINQCSEVCSSTRILRD